MTELKFHEAANLFPMMGKEQFEELKADIKKNGLLEPIWLRGEEIIDGRNRYLACKEVGVGPKHKQWFGEEGGELINFIVSQNLHRRHLTAGQRAKVAIKIEALLVGRAKERQRAAGRKHGRGQKKDAQRNNKIAFPKNGKSYQEDEKPDDKITFPKNGKSDNGAENKLHVTKTAAKIAGVSHGYVSDAKKIIKTAPEKYEPIDRGEKTIPQVMKEIKKEAGGGSKKTKEVKKKDSDTPKEKTQREAWEEATKLFEKFVHEMAKITKQFGLPPDISNEDRTRYYAARSNFLVLDNWFKKEV